MADASQRTPEEAYTDLEARLRAEEPPIDQDDTSPSKAMQTEVLLRNEEPPVSADDTSPSLVSRPALANDDLPPHQRSSGSSLQRVLALLMLSGAVILTALATYVWMDAENTPGAPDEPALPSDGVDSAPDQIAAAQVPTGTATLTPTQAPAVQEDSAPPEPRPTEMFFIFPTAAADEIAAALLTPVPGEAFTQVIERDAAPFTIHPSSTRSSVVQYTVQQGDTLQTIASKFDLEDYYSIVWSNSRSKYSALQPGTQLNIPPEDGVYFEVTENITIAELAEKYSVDPYTIIDAEYNNLFGSVPANLLPKGLWVIIPGGEGERVNLLPANPQSGSSGSGASGVVSGPYTLWGCSSNIGGGSPPYTRPLNAYTWMQGFSLGGHEGVDLAANEGTPVFAAGGGTVAFAGWNATGYGNVIVIAHGDTFTVYGHLARATVSCGQSVSAGQQIAQSGNSGNSTGPHLHFEVRDANWNAINPRNYIGF